MQFSAGSPEHIIQSTLFEALESPKAEWMVAEPSMVYGSFFNKPIRVVELIRRGLSFSHFENLKAVLPFSDAEWADYLQLSLRTLQRSKQEKDFQFKALHTEKILELAEVTALGLLVFDSPDAYAHWLRSASLALGGHTPADLLKDSYGQSIVLNELHRIDNAIFA